MGLGKRDLGRKRKSIEMKIQEIEAEGISYSLTPMGSELRKIMIDLFSYLDRK